jgi:hypothetical protein
MPDKAEKEKQALCCFLFLYVMFSGFIEKGNKIRRMK